MLPALSSKSLDLNSSCEHGHFLLALIWFQDEFDISQWGIPIDKVHENHLLYVARCVLFFFKLKKKSSWPFAVSNVRGWRGPCCRSCCAGLFYGGCGWGRAFLPLEKMHNHLLHLNLELDKSLWDNLLEITHFFLTAALRCIIQR